jgi:hypothetical protein
MSAIAIIWKGDQNVIKSLPSNNQRFSSGHSQTAPMNEIPTIKIFMGGVGPHMNERILILNLCITKNEIAHTNGITW